MKLEGSQTFKATREELWKLLMDTDTLIAITPGVSHLEETDKNEYVATAEVKIGPVKGAFKGNLSMTEVEENDSFVLNISQKSKIGNAEAKVRINLTENSTEETALSFDGNVSMSGLLARTGARVMSGVSKSMTRQFFENLMEEVNKIKTT